MHSLFQTRNSRPDNSDFYCSWWIWQKFLSNSLWPHPTGLFESTFGYQAYSRFLISKTPCASADSSESILRVNSLRVNSLPQERHWTIHNLNLQDSCVDECGYSTAGKQLFNALRRLIPMVDGAITEYFDDSLPWGMCQVMLQFWVERVWPKGKIPARNSVVRPYQFPFRSRFPSLQWRLGVHLCLSAARVSAHPPFYPGSFSPTADLPHPPE